MTDTSVATPENRICVIVQPTFIPWAGQFDLADQADVMIILDDVQFSKQSWQQRNRLRTPEGLTVLSVPVKSSGRSQQLINEVELANEASVEKLLRSIQGYCARAPYFRDYFPGFSAAMREGASTGRLAGLNITVLRWMLRALGIDTPLVLSSSLQADGKRGDYVAALCEEVGATAYLSPAGAEAYLLEDRGAFDERHISVWLQVYSHPEYRQCFKPFEPYASALDLIFNTGPDALAILRTGRRAARALGYAPAPAAVRRYAFRVDASTTIGIGHLMRCLTLADRLQQRDGHVHFICRSLPEVFREQILAHGHFFHLLPPAATSTDDSPAHSAWLGAGWQEDATQTATTIRDAGGADVLVIDHYAVDHRWEAALRPLVRCIAVIDDLADRRHDCDLLLDQDYFPDPALRYAGLLPDGCQTLFGPGHALLRQEFIDAARTSRERGGTIRRILVFYGGADPDNLTGRTLDALAPRLGPELEADIVIGAINPHVDALRARCDSQPHVRLHVQAGNMAELIGAADLAFGACGTATWERCLLGLPAVVVVLADNQRESTQALVESGVVESLGEATTVTVAKLRAALDRLASDPARLRNMSAAARTLMHTDEAPIEDILAYETPFTFEDLQLRLVGLADAGDLLEWRMRARGTSAIETDEHARWMSDVIANTHCHLVVGERNGRPIGGIRLEESGDAGEISIYLSPDAHGADNDSALLRALEAWIRATRPAIQRLVAVVLGTNDTSHRLFLKNGYTCLPTHYEKRITR